MHHRGAAALERREEVIQDLVHSEFGPGVHEPAQAEQEEGGKEGKNYRRDGRHIEDGGSVSMIKTLHDKASVKVRYRSRSDDTDPR